MAYSSTNWPVGLCHDPGCHVSTHFSDRSIGRGSGKTAYYGRYCRRSFADKNVNQKAVVKFYNERFVFDEDFWSREIQAHKKANDFAKFWNGNGGHRGPHEDSIRVLIPRIEWVGGLNCHHKRQKGEYNLVEDYIPGFMKFNSNTMTCNWPESSVHAFCHWTYHFSGGRYLYCDAQGAYHQKKGFILTDPVIVSRTKSWSASYGPCDGGLDMMITWFKNHSCTAANCNPRWSKPVGQPSVYIQPTPRTSYVWNSKQFQQKKHFQGHGLNCIDEY